MDKKKIEALAQECLSKVENTLPIPVITIAQNHRLEVHEVAMPQDEIGDISSLLVRNGDGWVILVNEGDPATRKRFAIAHALGHFFFHPDTEHVDLFPVGETTILKTDSIAAEREANYFALCLLIPEDQVLAAWQQTHDIKELSKQFYVSHASMATRLESLDLVESTL